MIEQHQSKKKRYQSNIKQKNSYERGYNARWRKARLVHLSINPLCVHCEQQGNVATATVVDHIKAHQGDHYLFWDASNWQSLCASCHSKKTVKEDGGFGNVRGRG